MIYGGTEKNIIKAAELIRRGELVAFPTETVYGLGADALNPAAVARIFEAKGRPQDNPLIVHIADKEDINNTVSELTAAAAALIEYMPAPFTLVCKKNKRIPDIVTAGLDTVAVRIPDNSIARRLIRAARTPVAAPSANSSTRPSPTCAGHVEDDLGNRLTMILDGGECKFGLESTVIDVTGEDLRILRAGSFTVEQINACLEKSGIKARVVIGGGDPCRPSSPGMKYKHYAPDCGVIAAVGGEKIRERIENEYSRLSLQGKKCVIFAVDNIYAGNYIRLGKNTEECSRNLFAFLRKYEHDYDIIIIECAGDDGLGLALNNRILKAAAGNII